MCLVHSWKIPLWAICIAFQLSLWIRDFIDLGSIQIRNRPSKSRKFKSGISKCSVLSFCSTKVGHHKLYIVVLGNERCAKQLCLIMTSFTNKSNTSRSIVILFGSSSFKDQLAYIFITSHPTRPFMIRFPNTIWSLILVQLITLIYRDLILNPSQQV